MLENNKLPKDWKWAKLGDLIEMQSGVAFKKAEYSSEGVRLFQIANVSFNYTKWDDVEHLPIEYIDSHNHLLLKKGDIVLALNRPMLNNQLKIAELKQSDVPAILYQRVGRFTFDKNLNKRYFLYYFQSPVFLKWLGKQLQGVNIPFINKSKLFNYDKFPLPPSTEDQQAIVSKVEELFSELDKGIKDLKTAQQQLKIYRQSVLKYAFEGKFTNKKIKDGVLPKGWKIVKMADIVTLSSLKHSPVKQEELFYIGLEHIEKHTGKLTSKVGVDKITTIKNKFSKGDILYGKLRPNLNKVYLSNKEGVCSTDILVLKLSEKCLAKYLQPIMFSTTFVNEMSENTSGVNLPRVSTKFIMNYEIPLPTIEEQYEIVEEIESRLSVADKMEESIAQSLQQAEALRQSILKKAFSGELV